MAWYDDSPTLATAVMLAPIVIPYYVGQPQIPEYTKGIMTGHLTAATTVFFLISTGMLDY